jgi:drug/metabolite transporter (DMT)-like permease
VTVVAAKGALGAALTVTLAFALREPWPHVIPVLVLLACGATGYRLSLRLYLLAQRRIGAARTASIFALAPFVGPSWGGCWVIASPLV